MHRGKDGEAEAWEPATASAVKKATKLLAQHTAKVEKELKRKQLEEQQGTERREAELRKLEDAKAIVLAEPADKAAIKKIKIKAAVQHRGEHVRIFGWVHRLRQQGGMTFITLRDGTGYLQCVLTGKLVRLSVVLFLGWFVRLQEELMVQCCWNSLKPTTPSPSPSNLLSKLRARLLPSQRARRLRTAMSLRPTGGQSLERHPEETRPSATSSQKQSVILCILTF